MKRSFLITLLFLTSTSINADGILDDYDSDPIKFRLSCWTGETGWKSYAVQGNNVVVDSTYKVAIVEQKGNIYAAKGDEMFGELVLIIDYDNRKVTQNFLGTKEVFECQ